MKQSGFHLVKRVIRHEAPGFHDYSCLQTNAFRVVFDSGPLPEESGFFTSIGHPFPDVRIRTSTEHPEALDKACIVLAGIDERMLIQAVEMTRNDDHGIPVPDDMDENVSTKVVKIIQSDTGVVNKMVWKKLCKGESMFCEQMFRGIYNREPEGLTFCPYRICPIGAHSDHQYGKITGLAIDKGIHIAYRPKKNGIIEMASLQFDKRAQWHVGSVPPVREGDWADHLRGATLELSRKYPLSVGLCGIIEGSLPIGGLSSSAAVIIAFLSALCRVNDIHLKPLEMILIAQRAENGYVGVACGKLDQSCEVYSKKDHLLYLDTLDDSYELIPTAPAMKPYRIAVFFSGLERSLAGSKFNMRVDECRSAAYALKAFSGMEYGKFEETHLREVPYETYLRFKDRLPENWAKRAEHWYTEFDRVQRGAEAWRSGDIETYGKLSFESGRSSIYNYETGSPELKKLYEIMLETDGIYGGRFSGAGFKGCCMALIDPAFEESILERVETEYLKEFTHLKGKYSAHVCQSTDGVRV